jgi:hypothetical protein
MLGSLGKLLVTGVGMVVDYLDTRARQKREARERREATGKAAGRAASEAARRANEGRTP